MPDTTPITEDKFADVKSKVYSTFATGDSAVWHPDTTNAFHRLFERTDPKNNPHTTLYGLISDLHGLVVREGEKAFPADGDSLATMTQKAHRLRVLKQVDDAIIQFVTTEDRPRPRSGGAAPEVARPV